MIRAALAKRAFWSSAFSGSASSSALLASRTWQIVTSGFFSPQPLGLAGQEQMTDLREAQVPQHRRVLAALEVAQAQFALLVFDASLHRPATERHVQDRLQ